MATNSTSGGRIYSSKAPETTYQGSARGGSFNAVRAQNDDKAQQQEAQARERDNQTKSRELARAQKMETVELQAQQTADSGMQKLEQGIEADALKADQLWEQDTLKQEQTYEMGMLKLESTQQQLSGQVASARLQATSTAIQGVMSLSKSYMAYQQQMDGIKKKDAAVNSLINGGSVLKEGAQQGVVDKQVQTATQEAAIQVAPNEPSVRAEITQQTSDAAAQRNIGAIDTRQAMMILPATIDEYTASDAAVQLPDGRVLRPSEATSAIDAGLIQGAYLSQALKDLGVADLPTAELHEYVGQIQQTGAQKASQAGTKYNKRRQEEKVATAFSLSETMYADGASAGENYRRLSNELFLTGKYGSKKEANDAAIKQLSTVYANNEDSKGLRDLLDEPKFIREDGTAGPSVGSTYGAAIRDAADKIDRGEYNRVELERKTRVQGVNTLKEERFLELAAAGTDAAKIEEIERKYHAEALKIPGLAGQALATSIAEGGFKDSPQAYNALVDQVYSDEPPTDQDLRDYLEEGVITPTQYSSLSKANTRSDGQRKAALEPYAGEIKGIASSVIGSIKGELGMSGSVFSDQWKADTAGMVGDMNERISQDVFNYMQENPEVSKTPGKVREFTESRKDFYIADIKAQSDAFLEAQAKLPPTDRELAKFEYKYLGGGSTNTQTLPKYTDAKSGREIQVMTGMSTEEFKGLEPGTINPINARILNSNDFTAGVESLSTGNPDSMPRRIVSIAKSLGMTPRVLLEQQGWSQGMDVRNVVSRQLVQIPQDGPVTMEQGMAYMESMGFTTKGSAYLSGNIQQESSWNGRRDWGQVAGDGTSRNGGLISWASWSDDAARLGNAEAYLGKSIDQATHAEQLAFMEYEMKTSYPEAYRIFTDESARTADLERASVIYWGYGDEGDRFDYAQELLN